MRDPFEGALKYLEEIETQSPPQPKATLNPVPQNRPDEHVETDISEGRIIALKICSHVLDACIWLALDEDFEPDDEEHLAVFYASEIPLLKDKSEETLRKIHESRLIFNGGKVVDPEELQ